MRPITMPASASSNSGPSLSVRIFANSSAFTVDRSTSSLCDFPRPRKCRTVRWVRAQRHHSSSEGNLTSQRFSPPDKIGTTNGLFASNILNLLLRDTADRRGYAHRHQTIGGVVQLNSSDLERQNAIGVSEFSDTE